MISLVLTGTLIMASKGHPDLAYQYQLANENITYSECPLTDPEVGNCVFQRAASFVRTYDTVRSTFLADVVIAEMNVKDLMKKFLTVQSNIEQVIDLEHPRSPDVSRILEAKLIEIAKSEKALSEIDKEIQILEEETRQHSDSETLGQLIHARGEKLKLSQTLTSLQSEYERIRNQDISARAQFEEARVRLLMNERNNLQGRLDTARQKLKQANDQSVSVEEVFQMIMDSSVPVKMTPLTCQGMTDYCERARLTTFQINGIVTS